MDLILSKRIRGSKTVVPMSVRLKTKRNLRKHCQMILKKNCEISHHSAI